jgi:hypothetical protein
MSTQARMGSFSTRRFGQLLLREAVGGYRSLLIAMAAVGGSILLVSLLTALGIRVSGVNMQGGSGEYYGSFFANLLFIGGFVVTSIAFREVYHNGSGIFYLTLPGSVFEKYLSKLLMTALGYAVGVTVFFTAVAAATEGITLAAFGVGHGFFNPFTLDTLTTIGVYMAAQSVFLLGSIWFRKAAFISTVLWIVIFVIAAAIITAVVARFVIGPHLVYRAAPVGEIARGWSLDMNPESMQALFGPGTRGEAGLRVFGVIGKVLLYLAAPVFWVAGYFRLREVEV